MSWTDKELDELFKDAADGQSFEYNAAYFKDIEAQLPVNKGSKRVLYWIFGGSIVLLIILPTLQYVGKSKSSEEQYTAQTKVNTLNNDSHNNSKTNNSSISHKAEEVSDSNNQLGTVERSVNQIDIYDQQHPIVVDENNFESSDQSARVKIDEESVNSPMIESLEISFLEIAQIENGSTLYPEIIDQAFDKPFFSRSKSKIFIEFAGGIGQSPVSSTENGSSRSMSWSLSGGYLYSKHNWSLSAGAGVSELYFNNLFIKERSTIYGFGVNTYDNHYQFASMFKMDLPVSFSYHLGSHELSAGVNTSIPLFARVNYVELKDGQENSQGKSFSSTSPYFKMVLLEPSIGYRFQMDENWSIGAALKAQLINPLGSDRVKGDRNNLPLTGQITLRKTFELR